MEHGDSCPWEVYVPEPNRRFGYYAMPILAGDRMIGRIDPRLDQFASFHGARTLTIERSSVRTL